MNVHELIDQLKRLAEHHGNIPVENEYGHSIDSPEFNDDVGSCILISFTDRQ